MGGGRKEEGVCLLLWRLKIQNHWTKTSNELQYYLMGKDRLKKRAGE